MQTTPPPSRRALLAAPALLAALAACDDDASHAPGGAASDGGAGSDGASDGGSTSSALDPIRTLLDSLDPAQMAGQLVLVGVEAGTTPEASLFEDSGTGGYFLLGRWSEADAVRAVVSTAAEHSAIPPLGCADQEGGQIRVLRPPLARATPSAETLGERAASEHAASPVTEAYRSIGEDLAQLGLSATLAPVADVVDPDLGTDNAPVGALQRGFGTDPSAVADCVDAAVRALSAERIACSLKHFPGLGRVRENTDFSADGIRDTETTADSELLEPFRAGIAAGAGMVMLSSAVYERIDPDTPAMFSRAVVTDLLRGDLGFTGLVITDDIGSAAAVQDVPVGERATRLLAAGGDAVLTADPSLAPRLVRAITAWAKESEAQAAAVRAACERMLRLKAATGLEIQPG